MRIDVYPVYTEVAERDLRERITQRAHDLRRFLQNALERDEKKLAIQRQTLLDAENMDDLRRKGDLITASIHLIPRGAKKISWISIPRFPPRKMRSAATSNTTSSRPPATWSSTR